METSSKTLLTNQISAGITVNVIGLIFLLLINMIPPTENDETKFGLFLLNYTASFIYFIYFIFSLWIKKEDPLRYRSYLLSLGAFSISAYCLNHILPVFATFSSWTYPIIVANYLVLIGSVFSRFLPLYKSRWIVPFYSILLLFNFYQILFTAFYYPFGMIGILAIGIGAHILVPLLMLIAHIKQIRQNLDIEKSKILLASSLVLIMLLGVVIFKYYHTYRNVKHLTEKTLLGEMPNDLPEWVNLANNLSDDRITQSIVEGSLVYQKLKFDFNGLNFVPGFQSKINDPIMSTLLAICGDIPIGTQDRVNILKSYYVHRHKTHRKLWSDDHLYTQNVVTQIDLMPEYRLAYVQKDIIINSSSRRDEEALYLFELPQGAIATSMSLWVNGVEESSRLTTRCKADSAYVAIVGVERRDPALMHWQEGNQVTVNVFPVNSMLPRRLRVGFTIPLSKEGNELRFKDIAIRGPEIPSSKQLFRVHVIHDSVQLFGGHRVEPNVYEFKSSAKDQFTLTINAVPLSTSTFHYDGYAYQVTPAADYTIDKSFKSIYLDYNVTWDNEEINQIIPLLDRYKLYVFQNGIRQLDRSNIRSILSTLKHHRSNTFPYDLITDPSESLVITKSVKNSPGTFDLKGSGYTKKLKYFVSNNKTKLSILDLGDQDNAILKMMEASSCADVVRSDIQGLQSFLTLGKFISPPDSVVYLSESNLEITKTPINGQENNAPDHLMRLYNYHQLMKHIGKDIFDANLCQVPESITLAEEAHICSPVTSLIVLESQQDYDRFDIKKHDGLQNAKLKSAGAVPEPHEWVLIILAIASASYLLIKKKYAETT